MMKVNCFNLVCFCIWLLCLNSEIKSQNQIDNLIKEGLKYSYDFELEKAEKIFDSIIKKYPDNPRGYHYKSIIYIWSYLGNSEKSNYDNFISLSDQAINKAEKILDEDNKDENANYVLGSSYGYRSIAFGKSEKYLDMIWASQKSNTYLNTVLKINPDNYDAYFGIGLFKFALSQVPSTFKWALNIIGFHGDQQEGLNDLISASEKGIYTKTEAEYYLSQIYTEFYNDLDKSSQLLKSLTQKYPQNVLFTYSYAVTEIKKRDLNDAEKILSKLVKNENPNFKQVISYSNFLMGDVLFRKNKFEDAKSYYQNFISTSLVKEYKGIAAYRLGICYEMLDDYQTAKSDYLLSANGNLMLDDDNYAKRKGEDAFKKELSQDEKKIIQYSNFIEAGQFEIAYDSLNTLLQNISQSTLKAEINMHLSDAAFELTKYNESLNYALSSLQYEVGEETWIKAFANFFVARSYWKLGNNDKAVEYLEKAENSSDYDYHIKLKSLINNLKLSLNL
jgi:tetratricopeptide (TPR) repeat protein